MVNDGNQSTPIVSFLLDFASSSAWRNVSHQITNFDIQCIREALESSYRMRIYVTTHGIFKAQADGA